MFIVALCLKKNTAVVTENHSFKTCLPLSLSWGTCIYMVIKELSLYLTTKFNLEDMNAQIRQWF